MPLDHTTLCSNRQPPLLTFTAVREDVDRFGRQLLSFSAARSFRQHLEARLPGLLLPEQRAGDHRGDLIFAHAPDAPPGGQPLVIQATPGVSQLAPACAAQAAA